MNYLSAKLNAVMQIAGLNINSIGVFMTNQEIIDEIKLALTGDVLELEIEDDTLIRIIAKCLRELERFWDESTLITVPYAACIDMSSFNYSSVVNVYRPHGNGSTSAGEGLADPLYMQQWMIFSNGGTMYNLNDYVLNYAAWTTLNQIRNTTSTDLSYKEDKHNNKLYINYANSTPSEITIEYIPKLSSAEDVKSDYWIDILIRLSIAYTKIVLGRIRTRFGQTNAQWTQDGERLLEEGNTEYKDLIEVLRANSNLIYGLD